MNTHPPSARSCSGPAARRYHARIPDGTIRSLNHRDFACIDLARDAASPSRVSLSTRRKAAWTW